MTLTYSLYSRRFIGTGGGPSTASVGLMPTLVRHCWNAFHVNLGGLSMIPSSTASSNVPSYPVTSLYHCCCPSCCAIFPEQPPAARAGGNWVPLLHSNGCYNPQVSARISESFTLKAIPRNPSDQGIFGNLQCECDAYVYGPFWARGRSYAISLSLSLLSTEP